MPHDEQPVAPEGMRPCIVRVQFDGSLTSLLGTRPVPLVIQPHRIIVIRRELPHTKDAGPAAIEARSNASAFGSTPDKLSCRLVDFA
jgi:hypothetical protein